MSVATELGVIAHLVSAKGFGFIRPSVSGMPDMFFHHSACEGLFNSLAIGQRVSFCRGTDERSGKPRAEAIKVVS